MQRRHAKILIAFFFVVVCAMVYFVVKKSYSAEVAGDVFDTLRYTKNDYEQMRAYYNSDTAFQNMLRERIQSGDSLAMQAKKLLGTSYELRYNGADERDIKRIIYAYRISKNTLDKFADIEDQLSKFKESHAPENAADSAIQKKLDSLMDLAREGKLKK